MHTHSLSFSAMGTTANVQVTGRHGARRAEVARRRIEECERLWSRFIADSDVSRMNRSRGQQVRIDPATVALLDVAITAWLRTGGLFSPFLQRAMVGIGYEFSLSAPALVPGSRSQQVAPYRASLVHVRGSDVAVFDAPKRQVRSENSRQRQPQNFRDSALDLQDPPIVIDRENSTVALGADFGIDFGGIAKGYCADLVLAELIAQGSDAALVDIGGDIAFAVSTEADRFGAVRPWRIAVDNPFAPGSALDHLTASAGGVATSSVLRRRWSLADGRTAHHLIDPRTGRSAESDLVVVAVAADTCVNAEILTKQFLLNGLDVASSAAAELGVDALLVTSDGGVRTIGLWEGSLA